MKESTIKTILNNAHAVAINLNDTFYYACADGTCIDMSELEDLEPVIEKYGDMAFVAYEAIKRGHDPEVTSVKYNPNFAPAKDMILDIMAKAEEFGEFYELRDCVKLQPLKPEQRKKLSKKVSRLQEWFSFFIGR